MCEIRSFTIVGHEEIKNPDGPRGEKRRGRMTLMPVGQVFSRDMMAADFRITSKWHTLYMVVLYRKDMVTFHKDVFEVLGMGNLHYGTSNIFLSTQHMLEKNIIEEYCSPVKVTYDFMKSEGSIEYIAKTELSHALATKK